MLRYRYLIVFSVLAFDATKRGKLVLKVRDLLKKLIMSDRRLP